MLQMAVPFRLALGTGILTWQQIFSIHMVFHGNRNLGHQHRLLLTWHWVEHELFRSAWPQLQHELGGWSDPVNLPDTHGFMGYELQQTEAIVGPWSQIWSLATTWVHMSPCSLVAAQAAQTRMVVAAMKFLNKMAPGGNPDPRNSHNLPGNQNHRSWLQ